MKVGVEGYVNNIFSSSNILTILARVSPAAYFSGILNFNREKMNNLRSSIRFERRLSGLKVHDRKKWVMLLFGRHRPEVTYIHPITLVYADEKISAVILECTTI